MSQEETAKQIGQLVLKRGELQRQQAAIKTKINLWAEPLLTLATVAAEVDIEHSSHEENLATQALSRLPELSAIRSAFNELRSTSAELAKVSSQLAPFGA